MALFFYLGGFWWFFVGWFVWFWGLVCFALLSGFFDRPLEIMWGIVGKVVGCFLQVSKCSVALGPGFAGYGGGE